MNPLTPDTQKKLRLLADKMPMVLVNTHEVHIMTKEELDEYGYVGAEKFKDGSYKVPMPVQIAMNHYRGLKKAWLKDGFKGCAAYIEKINKI